MHEHSLLNYNFTLLHVHNVGLQQQKVSAPSIILIPEYSVFELESYSHILKLESLVSDTCLIILKSKQTILVFNNRRYM